MLFSEEMDREVLDRFRRRREQFSSAGFPDDEALGSFEEDTRTAISYLYAWMPLADVSETSLEAFADFAERGVFLRRNIGRVRELPGDFFGEYVLFHRVNNEEIRPCRTLFGEKIDAWLQEHGQQDETDENLALAVNRWAAENGTYHSDDERTISALAFYERGYGRCGEESTFVVNAMRSIGIPARQVYSPLWAHTDDNHAWVEVWAGGRWQFLGACEPQPVLNQGWFNRAASRAMLVRSRAFTKGQFLESEEILGENGSVTECNQLSRYRQTRKLTIRVEDENGMPSPSVRVRVQLVNMAAWQTIAELVTDAEGEIRFSTGSGILKLSPLLTEYPEVMVPQGHEDLRIVLRKENRTESEHQDMSVLKRGQGPKNDVTAKTIGAGWTDSEYIAPDEQPVQYPAANAEQRAENAAFLKQAEIIRKGRTEQWKAPGIENFRRRNPHDAEEQRVCEQNAAVKKRSTPDSGKGNSIAENNEGTVTQLAQILLHQLSEKDLTDCREGVLEDHLHGLLRLFEEFSDSVLFQQYVAGPRVGYEVLMPWREGLLEALGEEQIDCLRQHPQEILKLAQSHIVRTAEGEDFRELIMTPLEAWRSGTGSELSEKILAVAIARTLGIPARMRAEDGEAEYYDGKSFVPFDGSKAQDACLILHASDPSFLQYLRTWSLSLVQAGVVRTDQVLTLEDSWKDGEMAVKLTAGSYRLMTANRLPKGNCHLSELCFTAAPGDQVEAELSLRKIADDEMLVSVSVPEFHLRRFVSPENGAAIESGDHTESGNPTENGNTDGNLTGDITGAAVSGNCRMSAEGTGSDLSADGDTLFLYVSAAQEPTEHILNEIFEDREAFAKAHFPIILITDREEEMNDPLIRKVTDALPRIQRYVALDPSEREPMMRSFYLDPGLMPFVFVTDGRLHGIFAAGGYQVGTGRMLLNILGRKKDGCC